METKVYKFETLEEARTIATLMSIEGISNQIFDYEDYSAVEVTGTPEQITRASALAHVESWNAH